VHVVCYMVTVCVAAVAERTECVWCAILLAVACIVVS